MQSIYPTLKLSAVQKQDRFVNHVCLLPTWYLKVNVRSKLTVEDHSYINMVSLTIKFERPSSKRSLDIVLAGITDAGQSDLNL